MKSFRSSCVALALAGGCLSAFAQSFVCGGVSVDESQSMKAQAAGHDMMLTFATSSGAYLADVAVKIQGPGGATVVDANCGGPIMLVDLPGPGTYRITATASGVTRQSSVSVTRAKRPATAVFTWPAGA
jgi:hypothetical protein